MSKSQLEFKVLAEKITEFKKENDLTYEQLGNILGVDKSHLYRIIKVKTYPSLTFLERLANFMNLPPYRLFVPAEELGKLK